MIKIEQLHITADKRQKIHFAQIAFGNFSYPQNDLLTGKKEDI